MKIGIISPFPELGVTHIDGGGVPAYTKNLAKELSKTEEVTIFCEKIEECKNEYTDSLIHIRRSWRKGYTYPLQIWLNCLRTKIDVFHVQHEYFLYGGILSAMLFPFLLMLLVTKAPIIVTLHGIISRADLDKISEENNSLPNSVKMFMLKINIWEIGLFSKKIIVHDKFLKEILSKEYTLNNSKIIVIPHGVENMEIYNDIAAKKILNFSQKKVILFFGYLVKRKGLEVLIEAFQNLEKERNDTVLVIGAGKNPRLKENKEYQNYYNKIKTKAEQIPNVFFIGFIPETKLKTYVSAADIIVFPYSAPIAASGALTYAISFGKIVLCSDIITFKDLVQSDTLLFKANDSKNLHKRLIELLTMNQKDHESLQDLIKNIRNDYSWANIAHKTLDIYKTMIKKEINV